MNPHVAWQLAGQHQADLRALAARRGQIRQARPATVRHSYRRVIRRRAGWALVTLGMRLVCATGEE
jgi:hypothetical protein